MKLFYAPGACSMAPHIVALEAGLDLELEKVDLRTKQTASGADFTAVNPKGYVPTLQLDDGAILTEGPVISQYLADLNPAAQLAPPAGTLARYRLQEMLTYINSELHKNYAPLFSPDSGDQARAEAMQTLTRRFVYLDTLLGKQKFLLGENFTAADAYLFTVLSWAGHVKLDLSSFANLHDFELRVATRPAVKQALKDEGLAH